MLLDNIILYNKDMKKIKPDIQKIKSLETAGSEEKKRYPEFSIGLKHLPEAKDWKVGNKYKVTLELEQTGLSIKEKKDADEFDINWGNRAEFNIIGIEVQENKKKEKVEKVKSRYNEEQE